MNLEMIDPKKHHQLFVDDFVIETSSGTSRSLHSPKKWGPLIKGGIQSRSTPQWNSEKKLWEWWYFGEGTRYAVSEDGENWELPSLGLFEMNGSRDNNVAFDSHASGPGAPFHVVRDETDPDDRRRYKGLLSGSNRFPAVSPDGFHWTAVGRWCIAPSLDIANESGRSCSFVDRYSRRIADGCPDEGQGYAEIQDQVPGEELGSV